MAGTARLNPRNAPILPLPNAPPREGFPYPAMPPMVGVGGFHPDAPPPMDHHRPLPQGLRAPPQHQHQQQHLKRGRASLRDDLERDRAAAIERDRIRIMMMERERLMMGAPPRHRMMMPAPGPGPAARGVFDHDPLPIPDARPHHLVNSYPMDAGRSLIDGPIDLAGRGARLDGPIDVGRNRIENSIDVGRSRMDVHVDMGRSRMDAHHDIVRSRVDGPRLGEDHHIRLNGPPSVSIPGMGDDLPHKMNGPGISMANIGDEPLYKTLSGPMGINNPYAPLPNIIHMDGGTPVYDDDFSSDVSPTLGHDNAAYRAQESPLLLDRRLKNIPERRLHNLEHSTDGAPEDPRLFDRRIKNRDRRSDASIGLDRKSETILRTEGIPGDTISMDRRSELLMMLEKRMGDSASQERKSDSGLSTGKLLDRSLAGMERRVPTSLDAQQECIPSNQRKIVSPIGVDKRIDSTLNEPEVIRAGGRVSHGKLPSLERGRSHGQEYEDDLEISGDKLRIDDIHIDRTDDGATKELVAQYKMALSELTFNSKPIITNLTIIAGENLHASRQIAMTVCSHILEVPVDQKLPSLYLLDSIVKNIGNEYVKHFSARLLEVFVKSYRQVDPTLHPAMQHLFKTWRGVFSMELLEKIESDLNLNIISNATQSTTAVTLNSKKTDVVASPQQPGHSIHVNPKYLEVQRQKMQQVSQAFAGSIGSDQVKKEGNSEDVDRMWDKNQHAGESGSGKSGLRSGLELPQIPPQPLLDAYGNIRGVRVARAASGIAPCQGLDVRDSVASDKSQSSQDSDNLRKDKDTWYPGDGYKNSQNSSRSTSLDRPILDESARQSTGSFSETNATSLISQTLKNLLPQINPSTGLASRQSTSSTTPTIPQNSISSPLTNRITNMGPSSPVTPVPGMNLSQRPQSPSPISPPLTHSFPHSNVACAQPPDSVHPQLQTQDASHRESLSQQKSDEKSHKPLPQLTPQLLESLQQLIPSLSGGVSQTNKSTVLNNLPSQPTETVPHPVWQENVLQEAPLHQWQSSPPQAIPSSKGPAANSSPAVLAGPENFSGTNNAMATFTHSGFGLTPQNQPPLPSGPPPFLTAQSGASVVSTSSGLLPVIVQAAPTNVQPPLPPGPPPVLSQPLNPAPLPPQALGPLATLGNNYTCLLSSLMAQGIINAPQGNFNANITTLLPTPFGAQPPLSKSTSDIVSSNYKFPTEFKQEVLRERHECVVVALYSAFPRQCTICGLRFKQQEEHSRHMDWHVSRNRQQKSSKKVSRRWYLPLKEWSTGTEMAVSEAAPAFFTDDAVSKTEEEELVAVPADENQITCFLCGEPFEDFYSDETEEWMYKGAVYMNVSQDTESHGPIVHAKCQSESTVSNVPNSGEDVELEDIDDSGSRRKRLRC